MLGGACRVVGLAERREMAFVSLYALGSAYLENEPQDTNRHVCFSEKVAVPIIVAHTLPTSSPKANSGLGVAAIDQVDSDTTAASKVRVCIAGHILPGLSI
jgi:hypothetical protein